VNIVVILKLNCVIYQQDTNRNLRAVDKMLERYKDIGEQKAAVVHVVCILCFVFLVSNVCTLKEAM